MEVNKIYQGDCIEELNKLPENSVDAIITDPPYGLEFMGKEWDKFTGSDTGIMAKPVSTYANKGFKKLPIYRGYTLEQKNKLQQFCYQWAIECLRVLKHGGFLLSFGGTRTYHRLVCGIEDAGFEIRDTIMWLYGSGFPKSFNIGKQIDKMNGRDEIQRRELAKYLREAIKKKGITLKELRIKLNHKMKGGGLIPHWITESSQPTVPTKKDWLIMKDFLNLDNTWDWFIDRIEAEREVIGKNDYTNPKELYQVGKEKEGIREDSLITAPNLPEAKQWEGWGTALKPACEPIVVARKPLSEKTIALNVLKHGTGGINIDACRIETTENLSGGAYCGGQRSEGDWKENSGFKNDKLTGQFKQPQGRFPANVIFDEEARKMLDEQSGTLKSGKDCKRKKPHQTNAMAGLLNTMDREEISYGDKGGASRFFYCAKASKSERNYGCEELPLKKKHTSTGDDHVINEICPYHHITLCDCGWRSKPVANNHPTVKPIKLMEYLIKLVTREGAIVLDPFVGSGTTLIACIKLGRRGIGIEKESEYIKIAEARLKPYEKYSKQQILT